MPRRGDAHHHPDPTEAWELVRVKTEVTLHLRDERVSDGFDIPEAFEACIAALCDAFSPGTGRYLNRIMEDRVSAWRRLDRAEREAADERRREMDLASGLRVACPDCGGAFRAGVGIRSHQRAKHGAGS